MYPYLRHLVLDGMNQVIKFEINIDLDDPVVKRVQLNQLFINVQYQFGVGIKVHRLDVYIHFNRVLGEKICELRERIF